MRSRTPRVDDVRPPTCATVLSVITVGYARMSTDHQLLDASATRQMPLSARASCPRGGFLLCVGVASGRQVGGEFGAKQAEDGVADGVLVLSSTAHGDESNSAYRSVVIVRATVVRPIARPAGRRPAECG